MGRPIGSYRTGITCPRCGERDRFLFITTMKVVLSAKYYGFAVASHLKNKNNGLSVEEVNYRHVTFRCKNCHWQGDLEDYADALDKAAEARKKKASNDEQRTDRTQD